MVCFSGCLMSSASLQKLFCEVCSALKCSFEEFVREKVVFPSYSSAIFPSPPRSSFFECWILSQLSPFLPSPSSRKRCHLIIPCAEKYVRSLKRSHVAGEQTQRFSPLENNFTVSYEVKHKLISQQSHSKKNENRSTHTHTHTHTHTKPLYANVWSSFVWKQSKCPSTDEWISKCSSFIHSNTTQQYKALNKLPTRATICTTRKSMRSDRGHTEN